jgi:hypothetical protein
MTANSADTREAFETLISEYGTACYAYSGEEQESQTYDALMQAIDALLARCEEYRKDAERWRFARNDGFQPIAIVTPNLVIVENEVADALADTAIAAKDTAREAP